jgi:ribosomal protein L6P/L9E
MYNSNYNFILPLVSSYCSIYINYNKDVISIVPLISNSFFPTFTSHYNAVLHTFYKPTFKKLKFRGKGYYIYKNVRNTIAPQFGYSHRLYIYSYFNQVKFIGKTKIILFGLVKEDVVTASLTLKLKRNINIFTGRGVRFARQVVYKKQGKVSSYR